MSRNAAIKLRNAPAVPPPGTGTRRPRPRGWKSDEAMFEWLVLPDDVLFKRLGPAGLLRTSFDRFHRRDHEEMIAATTDRLAELVETAAREEIVKAADAGIQNVFADIEGITVNVDRDTASDAPLADEEEDEGQLSFQQFDLDEDGTVCPIGTAKVAYVAYVIATSWSVTLAPLLG